MPGKREGFAGPVGDPELGNRFAPESQFTLESESSRRVTAAGSDGDWVVGSRRGFVVRTPGSVSGNLSGLASSGRARDVIGNRLGGR